MMSHLLRSVLFVLPLALVACGGGGGGATSGGGNGNNGGGTPQPGTGSPVGSVVIAVDTATSSAASVQFQVAAAALERADGSFTPDLLGGARMVTFADPAGAPSGFALRGAPSGTYRSLRLLLAPGSGTSQLPSGQVSAITGPASLSIPMPAEFTHDATRRTWVEIGHVGSAPQGGQWFPSMIGRSEGGTVAFAELRTVGTEGAATTVVWEAGDDGPLSLDFGPGCTCYDDNGNSIPSVEFASSFGIDDRLMVSGRLFADGRCEPVLARRLRPDAEQPRWLGVITSVDAATSSFGMEVVAHRRGNETTPLATPTAATILASTARLHGHRDPTPLPFSTLSVGDLVKVEWRSFGGNGTTTVVADEIELTNAGEWCAMQLEWEGMVHAVDLVAGTITVVPRNQDPIVIQGQSVAQAQLLVNTGAYIERRAESGGGRSRVGLGDLVPGADRIWWRGAVTGPTTMNVGWVRVRNDD